MLLVLADSLDLPRPGATRARRRPTAVAQHRRGRARRARRARRRDRVDGPARVARADLRPAGVGAAAGGRRAGAGRRRDGHAAVAVADRAAGADPRAATGRAASQRPRRVPARAARARPCLRRGPARRRAGRAAPAADRAVPGSLPQRCARGPSGPARRGRAAAAAPGRLLRRRCIPAGWPRSGRPAHGRWRPGWRCSTCPRSSATTCSAATATRTACTGAGTRTPLVGCGDAPSCVRRPCAVEPELRASAGMRRLRLVPVAVVTDSTSYLPKGMARGARDPGGAARGAGWATGWAARASTSMPPSCPRRSPTGTSTSRPPGRRPAEFAECYRAAARRRCRRGGVGAPVAGAVGHVGRGTAGGRGGRSGARARRRLPVHRDGSRLRGAGRGRRRAGRSRRGRGRGRRGRRSPRVAGCSSRVETLDRLRRGGRIGAAAAFVGTALAVKPLLHVAQGRIVPLEKVRTTARAAQRLVELAVTAAGDGPVDLAVHHLAAADPRRGGRRPTAGTAARSRGCSCRRSAPSSARTSDLACWAWLWCRRAERSHPVGVRESVHIPPAPCRRRAVCTVPARFARWARLSHAAPAAAVEPPTDSSGVPPAGYPPRGSAIHSSARRPSAPPPPT